MHLACGIHKGQLHFPREDVLILEQLLKNGGANFILQVGGEDKETPMHYVARTGNADILSSIFQKLDEGKAQLCVNMQSAKGWSPLCEAAHQGHVACSDLLIKVILFAC